MSAQEVFETIVKHARVVVPGLADHEFKREESLKDLGADSVDRAEITMMTMEDLSLKIPRVEMAGASNIGELTDLFYQKLQDAGV